MVFVVCSLYLTVQLFGHGVGWCVVFELYTLLYSKLLLILLTLLLRYLHPQIQLIHHHHLHKTLHPLPTQLPIHFKQQSNLKLVIMTHELNVLWWGEFFEIILWEDLGIDLSDVLGKVVVLLD